MSFTKGVSFHHEDRQTINNNITINNSNEQSNISHAEPGEVKYGQVEPSAIERENEFLKKVLNLYMNQKLYWQNKSLILASDELLDLIQTLLPNKNIVITSNDIEEVGCCDKLDIPIRKIESIWVGQGDVQENFKYVHSNLVSLLESYKISIKFVRSSD